MAAARPLRKPHPAGLALALAAGVGLLGAVAGIAAVAAATTEYIVVDRNSGLAISGFDPIAYFTDGAAKLGRGEFEFRHAGAVWRRRL
jgi:hypothetical protein